MIENRQRVLDFVWAYHRLTGYPPTIREIAANTGISSTSVVAHHLNMLQRGGYIQRETDKARTIRAANDYHEPDVDGVLDAVFAALARMKRAEREAVIEDLRIRLEEL